MICPGPDCHKEFIPTHGKQKYAKFNMDVEDFLVSEFLKRRKSSYRRWARLAKQPTPTQLK